MPHDVLIAALGPMQRAALLATLDSPARSLVRGPGGWWMAAAKAGPPRSFTIRTVGMLARAWLVDLDGPFATTAPLTTKGVEVAEALRAATVQAGAA